MAKKKSGKTNKKKVETILHDEASRTYIPTAEYEAVVSEEDKHPIAVAYERRNPDLDPQLVWRGKDVQDWSDLVVQAPPLYIQEKVHPKVLIDDLMRENAARKGGEEPEQLDFFADFNGLSSEAAKTEFYQHEANWTNRMILGDSLQVMASLAEREGLRGNVQCIYVDPPYGIKFNSNFQWSTASRDVKDGRADHITREPEQVKAFRDTWRDGIHTYLTYLRDRLGVARDLLTDSGSIFVQIGDQNVHRVRAVLDEVFGDGNFLQQLVFRTTAPLGSDELSAPVDYILWYAKDKQTVKYRPLLEEKERGRGTNYMWTGSFQQRRRLTGDESNPGAVLPDDIFYPSDFASSGYTASCFYDFGLWGFTVKAGKKSWRTHPAGAERLKRAERLMPLGPARRPCFVQFHRDNPTQQLKNTWMDTRSAMDKIYVVQTQDEVVKRCLLMTSDPGDLAMDPTCGSGTTAHVAEQWGRRWITIDTSRVALALARARIMGARYPYYILADSQDGQVKRAEITGKSPSDAPSFGRIRQGFVYPRVPHIQLQSIANNAAIDAIFEKWHPEIQQAIDEIVVALRGHTTPFKAETGGRAGQVIDFTAPEGKTITLPSGEEAPINGFMEWEVPREVPGDWPDDAVQALDAFWAARIARQKEIDASIAADADYEYLYDRPYEDNSKVRVAGPFTVESLSPHRVLTVGENDELIDPREEADGGISFVQMILENLKAAGVQQAHKEDKIGFLSIMPWPGSYVCAEGRYIEGGKETGAEKRAAIFIGPEFGTVSRADLVAAAREAADAGFDVLIACAFSYDAQSTEFSSLGRIPVLKARMNADLHMAKELKTTGKGNLFVVFGEPDIELIETEDGRLRVKIEGVDVFDPTTGEVRSDSAEGIACWFIDTNYNEESFFVRHAYFLGANDPYESLKTSLKAEINREEWESLHSDVSRPFERPSSCRIAVKVINHLGDEVMKVFRIN